MSRSTFFSLDDELQFGKYMGSTLREVLESHPDYIIWYLGNLKRLQFSQELIAEITEDYPSVPSVLFSGHELEEDDEADFDYDSGDPYYEDRHYEEYAGSYAQEVMGWSDEMIDDVLDGDPDAYWNID